MARVPVHRQISNMASPSSPNSSWRRGADSAAALKTITAGRGATFLGRQPTTKKPGLLAPALTTQGDELESAVQFAA